MGALFRNSYGVCKMIVFCMQNAYNGAVSFCFSGRNAYGCFTDSLYAVGIV